jgi:hypothetical protein
VFAVHGSQFAVHGFLCAVVRLDGGSGVRERSLEDLVVTLGLGKGVR